MRIFGFDITRRSKALSNIGAGSGGWQPLVREPFAGAWQHNVELNDRQIGSHYAAFACRTLIASDLAKLRIKLVQLDENGIWTETTNAAYSPVLRKPNDFQTRCQFMETWMLSKLQYGNALILKQRDGRGVVVKMYVLDWTRVMPLLADDGSIFYQLSTDKIAGLPNDVIVPAREVIHDRFNCLYHPLIGIGPVFAHALESTQSINIQTQSALLYQNNSMPAGLLVAPTAIDKADAEKLKAQWEASFGGVNRGRVGVIGNNVKFEKLPFSAVEGQLIDQLKWTAEAVCATYHVPPYKAIGGEMPKFSNVQALNIEYYSQALQIHMEQIEACLDEGLGTGIGLGTEFDQDNLLRMDSVTQMEVLDKAKSIMTPDEQRNKLSLPPTPGGKAVYRQQQDFSLEALAKRDAQDDPFASGKTPAAAPAADAQAANDNATAAAAKEAMIEILKGFHS